MRNTIENTGFGPPAKRGLGKENRTVAFAELVAGGVLALATLVVVTVLSVGIAHAEVADGAISQDRSFLGIAVVFGMVLLGIGGAIALPGDRHEKH